MVKNYLMWDWSDLMIVDDLDLTPKRDARSENSLALSLKILREAKPNDRSEKDRRYAVAITELEKVYAYFNTYVISGLEV